MINCIRIRSSIFPLWIQDVNNRRPDQKSVQIGQSISSLSVRVLCSNFILEPCGRSLQENIISLYSLGCCYL